MRKWAGGGILRAYPVRQERKARQAMQHNQYQCGECKEIITMQWLVQPMPTMCYPCYRNSIGNPCVGCGTVGCNQEYKMINGKAVACHIWRNQCPCEGRNNDCKRCFPCDYCDEKDCTGKHFCGDCGERKEKCECYCVSEGCNNRSYAIYKYCAHCL